MRGTALRHFAVHHCLDVVAHQSHGGEQGAEFVGAAFRNDDVELAGRNVFGDVRSDRDRPHDSPRQGPGHHRRQQERQRRAGDIEIEVARDGRARGLPVKESIARGVIDQEIDLLVDLAAVLIEHFPVRIELGPVEQAFTHASPSRHLASHIGGRLLGAIRLRALHRDRQIVVQRLGERIDLLLELDPRGGLVGNPKASERRAHGGEVGGRRPRVIDRHQRFVIGLVDQNPGVFDAKGGVAAKRRRDRAHDQERDQNPARGWSRRTRPPGAGRDAIGPPFRQSMTLFCCGALARLVIDRYRRTRGQLKRTELADPILRSSLTPP